MNNKDFDNYIKQREELLDFCIKKHGDILQLCSYIRTGGQRLDVFKNYEIREVQLSPSGRSIRVGISNSFLGTVCNFKRFDINFADIKKNKVKELEAKQKALEAERKEQEKARAAKKIQGLQNK
jgi:hypothetical protein